MIDSGEVRNRSVEVDVEGVTAELLRHEWPQRKKALDHTHLSDLEKGLTLSREAGVALDFAGGEGCSAGDGLDVEADGATWS
jgi:hypothetical protein